MNFSKRTDYIFKKYYQKNASLKSRQIYDFFVAYLDSVKNLGDNFTFHVCDIKIREAVQAYLFRCYKI